MTLSAAGPKSKVDREALYKKHCQVCHAADGAGAEGFEPPDFTYSKWQLTITDSQIREAILKGSPPMPAFKNKLSAAEVDALMKKVRTFGKDQKPKISARPPP